MNNITVNRNAAYGCGIQNEIFSINLTIVIINIIIGTSVLVSNSIVLIIFIRTKSINNKNICLILLFMYNIMSSLCQFWTSINYCFNLEYNKIVCLLKFCFIMFFDLEILKLTLIISIDRFNSIKFNKKINNVSYLYFLTLLTSSLLIFLYTFSPLLFNWNKFQVCDFNNAVDHNYSLIGIGTGLFLMTSTLFFYFKIYLFVTKKQKKKSLKIAIIETRSIKDSYLLLNKEKIKISKLNVLKIQIVLFQLMFFSFIFFLIFLTIEQLKNSSDSMNLISILRHFLFSFHLLFYLTEPILYVFKILSINKIQLKINPI